MVGYELDDFVNFLTKKYSLAKTKFCLKWEELVTAIQEWAAFQSEYRKRGKVEDWLDENEPYNSPDDIKAELPFEEGDELDVEKYRQRERSKDLLTMKLQNYSEQINDIFRANRDQGESEDDSEEETHPDTILQVRINKLNKVLKDIGYLTGIVFTTWDDYISGEADEKRTKKEIVERIKKLMWKEVHEGICINVLESKGRKLGDGILKQSTSPRPIKTQDDEHDDQQADKQKDKVENKEDDNKTDKGDDKTVNNETNKDDTQSVVSPSHRPETSKSDTGSENSATTKKTTKTVAEDQTEVASPVAKSQALQNTIKTTNEEEPGERSILFEDEAYQLEHKVNYVDYQTFLTLLRNFFEDNDDLIVLDHLHEYDEQIAEAFKAATDVNYDPFKEKLKKTLEQYENTLIKGDFKDEKERDVTEKIIQDLRNQIARIEQSRSQTSGTDRGSKKPQMTIEDMRKRGLKEIFDFYSKQHLPEGQEFGDILDKMKVIDLGEFCIFTRDFDIKLPKKKLIEIFKKTSDLHHQPLNFKQFCESIDKIGVAINQERIKGIKKRLAELTKIESERENKTVSKPKPKEPATKKPEKDDSDKSDEDSEDEEEKKSQGDKQDEKKPSKEEKEDDKPEESPSPDKIPDKADDKTSKKSDESDEEDSGDETKSKVTKTNAKSQSESRRQSVRSKSVKFNKGQKDDESEDKEESASESEEETDPIKIEKKKLEKELDKYNNYGYNETHNEIMEYLEVHDPQKYRLRAKGVLVVPFFMKGKYGQARKVSSQHNHYSQTSTDERPDKQPSESKESKRKKIIEKEKLERIKQYKLKSRNQMVPKDKGAFNTLSPNAMKNKLNLNGNLLKQNKNKLGLKPKEEKSSQKVTLELLQHMNLKDFNQHRYDEFKPRDILGEDENLDDDSSVFNYFFPENSKAKKTAKMKKTTTTTNKFSVRKAVIKDPLSKVNEEEEGQHYYSEHEMKLGGKKSSKSKAGNLTSRVIVNSSVIKSSHNNDTRRSKERGALTGRKSNKSAANSKSKSKAKNKQSGGMSPKRKASQKDKMLSRAAQIDKQRKMDEKNTLNRVLKMHDNQMKKGLNVLKKKKV